jgi:DNA helicase HerA-like ATPase
MTQAAALSPEQPGSLFVGKGETATELLLRYANRHGLIAGATGTGKTVTMQVLAESFSKAGVPVFMTDVKGDISGISKAGTEKGWVMDRAHQIGWNASFAACPTVFWDIFGKNGHPVRTTVSEMGPLLLGRLLELNDTQEAVLDVVFAVADKQGLLLLDLDDLRAMLTYVSENASEISATYGAVSPVSIAAIQRGILSLEQEGGKFCFGEPALELSEFLRTTITGEGIVNILSAESVMTKPRVYATFLLWLLSELFENLPEIGDVEKPKLVFFFDEAHLLFDDAPKALTDRVEQLVRLIRSKGVGVYFVTQSPSDIPEDVLAQLSNRVQHALRAYTPKEIKGVKAAAESFRANPTFKTEEVITELAVGEALTSFLDAKGTPVPVQRTFVRPPMSQVGPITPEERAATMQRSPVAGKYEAMINRESAHEKLNARHAEEAEPVAVRAPREVPAPRAPAGRRSDSATTALGKSVVRSIGSTIGREVARGLMKSLVKSFLK